MAGAHALDKQATAPRVGRCLAAATAYTVCFGGSDCPSIFGSSRSVHGVQTMAPAFAGLSSFPRRTRPRRSFWPTSEPTAAAAWLSQADYTREAASLFENVRGIAVFIMGAAVPLGFFALPRFESGDTLKVAQARRLHYLVATVSICCQLVAIWFATVAVNKLTQTRSMPAASVGDVLVRDYKMAWLGCIVSFLLGLFGFTVNLVTFAIVSFGAAGKGGGVQCLCQALPEELRREPRRGPGRQRRGRPALRGHIVHVGLQVVHSKSLPLYSKWFRPRAQLHLQSRSEA